MRSRTHRGLSHLRAARTVVLFLALAASTLTGCSAEDPRADDPSGSAGPSGSVGPIDESTGTPSGASSSPTEPDGPLVATGPVIEQNALHLTLTEGDWITDRIGSAISVSDTAADGPFRV